MMKWSFAINAVLGLLLVVPAVSLAGGGEDLEKSLDRTVIELEKLAGLKARLEKGDRGAIPLVRQATDAPLADARSADERLAGLRREVSRLQMIQDGAAADDRAGDAHPAIAASAKPGTNPGATSFEEPGFSADPVRQGEACYRAGRFAQCIEVLKRAPGDPRANYWTARADEQIGKDDDAIAIYTKLADAKDAGWVADSARADLDYLRWKKTHTTRAAAETTPPVGRPAGTSPTASHSEASAGKKPE